MGAGDAEAKTRFVGVQVFDNVGCGNGHVLGENDGVEDCAHGVGCVLAVDVELVCPRLTFQDSVRLR